MDSEAAHLEQRTSPPASAFGTGPNFLAQSLGIMQTFVSDGFDGR